MRTFRAGLAAMAFGALFAAGCSQGGSAALAPVDTDPKAVEALVAKLTTDNLKGKAVVCRLATSKSLGDPGLLDVGVQVIVQIVMARHLMALAALFVQAHPGARAGVLPARVDAVHRLVGEEGPFGVAPPRGQRAGRGDKGPDVAVAGQGDEEGRRLVDAVDAVPALAVVVDEAAVHQGGGCAHLVQRMASSTIGVVMPEPAGLPVKA